MASIATQPRQQVQVNTIMDPPLVVKAELRSNMLAIITLCDSNYNPVKDDHQFQDNRHIYCNTTNEECKTFKFWGVTIPQTGNYYICIDTFYEDDNSRAWVSLGTIYTNEIAVLDSEIEPNSLSAY